MRTVSVSRNRKRHGLTLIELVVVIAVLAILAGFIVPRLGFVRNLAAESGNATIIADSATQAVFYNTAVGHYPGGEDTLLDTGNAVYANLNAKLSAILTPLDLSTDNGAGQSIVGQIDPNKRVDHALFGNCRRKPPLPRRTPISPMLRSSPGARAQARPAMSRRSRFRRRSRMRRIPSTRPPTARPL